MLSEPIALDLIRNTCLRTSTVETGEKRKKLVEELENNNIFHNNYDNYCILLSIFIMCIIFRLSIKYLYFKFTEPSVGEPDAYLFEIEKIL